MPRPTRSAADFLPRDARNLGVLRQAAAGCRGCDLYRNATQTVFGEGDPRAPIMLIGEKPGDQEDREGHPFVGPAGRELAHAIDAAGINPQHVYVTNVVKHFKFVQRGKRRIHQKPTAGEVRACMPWLDSEIEIVRPDVMVLLGATAARAVVGRAFRITKQRGEIVAVPNRPPALGTWHPSAILRADGSDDRARMRAELTADLEVAARYVLDVRHDRRLRASGA